MRHRTRSSTNVSRGNDKGRRDGGRGILAFLAIVFVGYLGLMIYHLSTPRTSSAAGTSRGNWLERCRELCVAAGLLPTGHIANDARAYLAATQPAAMTEALAEILDDDDFEAAESQRHPLVGKPAPEFSLPDATSTRRSLSQVAGNGAAIVVFYYGYGCSHCVAQLFALDRDLDYFRQLDFQVVAISPDTPEFSTEQFAKYGRFRFPVLSDVNNAVAERYGVYNSGKEGKAEGLDHGTFVIDRFGKVVWAYQGVRPFLDNKSLLHIAAKAQGLLPADR